MKIQNLLLTAALLVLVFIALDLGRLQELVSQGSGESRSIVASNQALIQSNQRLQASLDSLRQELADLREKVLKK